MRERSTIFAMHPLEDSPEPLPAESLFFFFYLVFGFDQDVL
jgi:hypothetical protein